MSDAVTSRGPFGRIADNVSARAAAAGETPMLGGDTQN